MRCMVGDSFNHGNSRRKRRYAVVDKCFNISTLTSWCWDTIIFKMVQTSRWSWTNSRLYCSGTILPSASREDDLEKILNILPKKETRGKWPCRPAWTRAREDRNMVVWGSNWRTLCFKQPKLQFANEQNYVVPMSYPGRPQAIDRPRFINHF